MAIVGEPCNVHAHANNPGLFMTMLCQRLCVSMYCTPVHTDYDCTVTIECDLHFFGFGVLVGLSGIKVGTVLQVLNNCPSYH